MTRTAQMHLQLTGGVRPKSRLALQSAEADLDGRARADGATVRVGDVRFVGYSAVRVATYEADYEFEDLRHAPTTLRNIA